MEEQTVSCIPRVKATICLGSETYQIEAKKGILSEQLISMKADSMAILKDFIVKHNVPQDVPDEISSDEEGDDADITEKPLVKPKKQKK